MSATPGLACRNATVRYGAFTAVDALDLAFAPGLLHGVIGPNGAGKTTLLRLIAGRLEPLAGAIKLGANVRLGVMAQEQETLDLDASVLQTALETRPMSETEARSFLHFFLFGGDSVFRRVGDCSLGERSRLQLALLVLRGCNLLLLDEPLNHLDIEGREHFEQALDAFEGTVIAVAHDRAFLRGFAERIVEVGGSGWMEPPAAVCASPRALNHLTDRQPAGSHSQRPAAAGWPGSTSPTARATSQASVVMPEGSLRLDTSRIARAPGFIRWRTCA